MDVEERIESLKDIIYDMHRKFAYHRIVDSNSESGFSKCCSGCGAVEGRDDSPHWESCIVIRAEEAVVNHYWD